MFITKKRHAKIVADLMAELKNANDWIEELNRQRDAAQKLAGVLDKLADKSASFSTFAAGSLNVSGELIMPDNIARFVPDHFGGQVLIQQATKVIEIAPSGDIKTGVTKRKPDAGCSYVLVRVQGAK